MAGTAGVIGLGDMGSGLARNLLKAGFSVKGYDLKDQRMRAFEEMGGELANAPSAVGEGTSVVFVMVMTGAQAAEVILGAPGGGAPGLKSTLDRGSVIILSATVHAHEAEAIAAGLDGSGIHLVDSPVSGGFPGAQGGTLTMMAAGSDEALAIARPAMEAVSSTIHRVGDTAPAGQIVKACLQSLIGSIFTATFEATVLAAKAGVPGEVLYNVFSTSSAGCVVTNTSLSNIMDRAFEGTGSHINTMYKDLTISTAMARRLGVPLFTATTALQLFQAGKTRHPGGDNWATTLVLEEIAGAELHRDAARVKGEGEG
ncbi:MAG: NAD(P)-dependent oxidoreductase [Pseudomonadota bacterium]